MCGLSINYPDNWVVEESNSKFEEGSSSLVSVAELMPNTLDGFRSTVQLDGEGISAFRDKSIEGIAEFMEFYHSNPGVTIVQSTGTTVQGIPAHEIVYEETSPSGDVWKAKETYFPSENTLYVIRYFTLGSEYYNKYITIVNDMIQSIKVDGCAC
ncbi:MAG: hypothetical protein L0H53_12135 [Candidatus Nitrosocosmicus sp.]|nr:hypothetical protein [Candidatus Nitrosocosmicus sp.]MDN5867055.1 hypothetical protein [Candidatus Nitrosocosmicus sp.]